ncbi:GTPase [Thermocladium modestius]|uniref:polynucleotide 5'-hydroxyl-kinase n=1 Tax=Thermocladium modestius TaxID=62609 RepID=A0A830GW51_9CREN|nr:GTPase [Thermocladium modestius]
MAASLKNAHRRKDVDAVNLGPGSTVRIEGPASVKVLRGTVYVLGTTYGAGSKLTILRTKKVVVKSMDESQLEVVLGPEGRIEPAQGEEGIEAWGEAAGAVARSNRRVVVLGMMDVGKTTFTIMVANKAIAAGRTVGVIDADPGQNDLGPPTTIACTKTSEPITHLSMLPPLKMVFLRTTSLEHTWREAIDGVAKLADYLESEGTDLEVINTDGWITEPTAIQYKLQMLERLGPDAVVLIQKEGEAADLLSAVKGSGLNVIQLPAPPLSVKTREERRLHREMGYGKYLMPARTATINLLEKPIINVPIGRGVPLDAGLRALVARYLGMPIAYGEQVGKRAIMTSPAVKELVVKALPGVEVAILPMNWEEGLLAALEDGEGYLVSLAMIKKIYYGSSRAVLVMPSRVEELRAIDHIRLGMIRLGDNYEEKEKVHYINKLERILSGSDEEKRG